MWINEEIHLILEIPIAPQRYEYSHHKVLIDDVVPEISKENFLGKNEKSRF